MRRIVRRVPCGPVNSAQSRPIRPHALAKGIARVFSDHEGAGSAGREENIRCRVSGLQQASSTRCYCRVLLLPQPSPGILDDRQRHELAGAGGLRKIRGMSTDGCTVTSAAISRNWQAHRLTWALATVARTTRTKPDPIHWPLPRIAEAAQCAQSASSGCYRLRTRQILLPQVT